MCTPIYAFVLCNITWNFCLIITILVKNSRIPQKIQFFQVKSINFFVRIFFKDVHNSTISILSFGNILGWVDNVVVENT
jgi:hypothetical protein